MRRRRGPCLNQGSEQSCEPTYNGTYDMVMFAERAIDVLKAHDESSAPFFMYLALHSVHEPDECPANWTAVHPIKAADFSRPIDARKARGRRLRGRGGERVRLTVARLGRTTPARR